jgi:PAS domain S-box-containing protein
MGIHRPDGSLRWISVNSEPISGPDGRTAGAVATFLDVTERRRVHDALREGHALLHSIAGGTPDAVYAKDSRGRYLLANPTVERAFGKAAADILGKDDTALLPPDEAARVMDVDREILTTGETRNFEETVTDTKGLSTFLTTKGPLRDADGVPIGVFGISHDVTGRRHADEELRASQDLWSQFIRRSPIFAYIKRVTPVENRVLQASENWAQMTGLSDPNVVGKTMEELFPPDIAAKIDADDRAILAGNEAVRLEEGLGGRTYTSIKFPIVLGDSILLAGYTLDVTEQRRAEEELRALQASLEQRVKDRTALLEEAARELQALTHSLAHELRTPLRAIDGFTAILARPGGGISDDEVRRLRAKVRWNAQRMGHLIDGLLDFARVGHTDIRVAKVDMHQAVRAAWDAVAPEASLPETSLTIGDLPEAHGDAHLLQRVFECLLSNAVKFSRARERPEILVDGSFRNGEAVFRVRDNGVGFEMRYVAKLFEVFQRLHAIHEFEGTGVGLALARRIVVRHGGQMWAEGEPDRGATFSFSLPTRPQSGTSMSWKRIASAPANPGSHGIS